MNAIDIKNRLNALIIYFSATGNTEKVANAIWETLKEEKVKVNLLKVQDAAEEELHDYNLIFLVHLHIHSCQHNRLCISSIIK